VKQIEVLSKSQLKMLIMRDRTSQTKKSRFFSTKK